MLSIDIIHIWRLSGNRKKTLWVDLEANSWRLMVNALHWGVIFQIHHMVEKIWWWGMITNGLKSPKDYFWRLEIKTWADMKATYIALLCHITYNVLISLITKKNVYWAIMEANIYVILPPKCIEFPQHLTILKWKNSVLFNSVHQWLLGCFWPFSYVYIIK